MKWQEGERGPELSLGGERTPQTGQAPAVTSGRSFPLPSHAALTPSVPVPWLTQACEWRSGSPCSVVGEHTQAATSLGSRGFSAMVCSQASQFSPTTEEHALQSHPWVTDILGTRGSPGFATKPFLGEHISKAGEGPVQLSLEIQNFK